MAVNVGERNVPEIPLNQMYYAMDQAKALATHTILICSNQKIFDVKFQSIIDKIVNTVLCIYEYTRTASDEHYKNDFKHKTEYINMACAKCNSLLALIDLCKPLFHLRSKKIKYWMKMTINTRKLLEKWYFTEQKFI